MKLIADLAFLLLVSVPANATAQAQGQSLVRGGRDEITRSRSKSVKGYTLDIVAKTKTRRQRSGEN